MKNIRAIAIIEIAGKPPEYISEAIKNHIAQLKDYKGLTLISDTYSKPKQIENSNDMYTCFSEVEFEVESFARLTELVFDFMPASIEIINPNLMELNIADATTLLNTLAGRLHKYDELAGVAQIQAKQLAQKLKEIYENNAKNQNKQLIINTNVASAPVKEAKKGKKKKSTSG